MSKLFIEGTRRGPQRICGCTKLTANTMKTIWSGPKKEAYRADDWSRVLWSDGSMFELWRTRGRVWVCRRQGERFLEECMAPTIKHGGRRVMVWGTMTRSGVGGLTVVDGWLNSEAYIKLANTHVKKNERKLIGRWFTFQQDGAPMVDPGGARVVHTYIIHVHVATLKISVVISVATCS